jgi:hypothetical protein
MSETFRYAKITVIVDNGEMTRTYSFPKTKNMALWLNQTEFSLRHPNAHHVTLDFDAEYDEVTGHVAQEVSERTRAEVADGSEG